MITQRDLKNILDYDPLTGIFTRKIPKLSRRTSGIAGTLKPNGYIQISISRKCYLAHRLAWLWMTGSWPVEVDHKNTVRSDNRWDNLRDATRSLNMQNQRTASRRSLTGLLGVNKLPNNRFAANIEINGARHYLGSYGTPELAHAAYIEAKRSLHPGGTI